MRNNKLHTPEGVKDFLPNELAFKAKIESKIENVFKSYGYLPISSPTFEYSEVFEGKESIKASQIYKFLDREGETLALRSDMTPAIARIAATAYSKKELPLKFSYIAESFRQNENYQGKLKEFIQAGVELIGESSDYATTEVIAIAVNSLLEVGLTDFRIDIGSVEFFKSILLDTGFDEENVILLKKYILKKDFVSANKMIENSTVNPEVKALFKELPLLIGKDEVIARAKMLTKNGNALRALKQLESIYKKLCLFGLEKYILYDLSMIGQLDYYTGIIFQGYTYDTPASIINGGRYDTLLKNFEADYPAVGFSIKMNMLISAIYDKDICEDNNISLIIASEKGYEKAIEIADNMRANGNVIDFSFFGDDVSAAIEYAKIKNIGGILYFIDNKSIEIINISENTRNMVDIDVFGGKDL